MKNKHIKPGKLKFIFGTDEDLDKARDYNVNAHDHLSYFFMFCFFVTHHSFVAAGVVGHKSGLAWFAQLHLRKKATP